MTRQGWTEAKLEDMLNYEQPSKYIVDSTEYNDNYKTPVLTAGKSFILGYTNEEHNIFSDIPVIIFDDFTTATQFVNFKFKVKSSAMKILKPTSHLVNLKYVFYYMQTIRHNTDTHKRYWISIFSKLPIKIAPISEQQAIVSKIEQLLSKLDNGINNLNKAKEKIEIYRQVVLKKAFEGELTKKWREKQTDLPSGDEILSKIKKERDKHFEELLQEWEQAVIEWREEGEKQKKPKKPRRLDTSVFDDYEQEFFTPKEWSPCQIADVISDLTDYHANGSYKVLKENVTLMDSPDYAIMVRATNFEQSDFKDNLKFINEHAYNFLSKSQLYGGEILIGKIGNAGRVYLMPKLNKRASLAMNLFTLRVDFISSKYLYYQLKNFYQEKEISSYVKGVGTPTIDKISVRSVHINLCSRQEQDLIVHEIETRMSVCDNILSNIEDALEKSEALRQSILIKSFDGKLLTEDELESCREHPDWEVADKLLERIKYERNEEA